MKYLVSLMLLLTIGCKKQENTTQTKTIVGTTDNWVLKDKNIMIDVLPIPKEDSTFGYCAYVYEDQKGSTTLQQIQSTFEAQRKESEGNSEKLSQINKDYITKKYDYLSQKIVWNSKSEIPNLTFVDIDHQFPDLFEPRAISKVVDGVVLLAIYYKNILTFKPLDQLYAGHKPPFEISTYKEQLAESKTLKSVTSKEIEEAVKILKGAEQKEGTNCPSINEIQSLLLSAE